MRKRFLVSRLAAFFTLALALDPRGAPAADGPFLVEPYVQLGDAPAQGDQEPLNVLWHTDDRDAAWTVEYRYVPSDSIAQTEARMLRRIVVDKIPAHRVYRAELKGRAIGREMTYRVIRDGEPVFTATARTRKLPGQPQRFVVIGDCGAGTPEQRLIANQIHNARPDYLVVTGDIVYSRGRISEYRERFYPAYNAAIASPTDGAPLLRSVPFFPAPGNHDISNADLGTYPDGLGFFLYWDLPRNGPWAPGVTRNVPKLGGSESEVKAFTDAAGPNFPRIANYSFDAGDVHWLMLDSNPYVDFNDPALREWITHDLTAAKDKPWRFVAFHHPGFSSSKSHFNDQRTKLLAPLFQRHGVAIVFAGHVHNYQRTHPLTFEPLTGADKDGRVAGSYKFDRSYDGRTKTRADGVIHIVTGAGGAKLYNPEQQDDPSTWQPFTTVFASKARSFTVVDVELNMLIVRQVSEDGAELDRFVVTR